MDSATVQQILKRNYVESSIHHTHVSLVNPRGKFSLNRQNLEEFWDVYCKLISENKEAIVGVAENPQQYLPVLADIDLRVREDSVLDGIEELYTEKQLTTIVGIYQSVLRQIVDNCTSQDLICVVLQKDLYQQTRNEITYLKHGFHLHFPYCFLNKVDQEVQLIPRVQDVVKEMKIFSEIGIEDSSTVIDKSVVKNQWLLYGSRKTEDSKPYLCTKIYDADLKEIELETAFKYYQIFDHREKLIPIKGKIEYYLPRILSVVPYGRPIKEIKSGVISPLKEKIKNKEKKSSVVHRTVNVEEAIIIAKKLLPLLSQYRSDVREEWMKIGWVLYNITEGSPEGLELWCDFSSRCEDKYDESVCINEWEKMVKREDGLGLGTLRHCAKTDNPAEYAKIKSESSQRHIINSLDGNHNDIAKALYAEYGDEFVCASFSDKAWFQYVGNKWEEIEEGVFLRKKISDDLVRKYIEQAAPLWNEMNNAQDKATQEMLGKRMKQFQKLIQNLKSSTFKNNVMKECAEVFYDPKFLARLNANPMIIGFRNGVYDLTNNVFRPGHPDDYISKCMPIDYVDYKEEDEIVQEVYTFLEQIFPDKSLRRYFLDIFCEIFVGGNQNKIVVFWTGEGDNGKSVMQTLFERMMGPLAVKLNTNVITGKKPSAGAAFADLARTGGGVRWAVLEEPDNDESINPGFYKLLSGNDSFLARDLFEKGKTAKEINPMFKLIFICNKLPHIKYADKAVWNRTRVLPFESTFRTEDVPETYEEQLKLKIFPKDPHFTNKISRMTSPFAWILLNHRKKDRVFFEPEKVTEATKFYQRQNNIYQQFMDENIIDDEKKGITLTELYSVFKEWFRESFPGNTLPTKLSVEEYFVKLWGPPGVGKKWKGKRQRVIQDNMEKGDQIITPIPLTEDEKNAAGLPPM